MRIISRVEAMACGMPRFFTGKPCKHGHAAERYTKDQSCVECKAKTRIANRESNAVYLREWRKRNPDYRSPRYDPEKEKERARQRYKDDPTQKLASVRNWRASNPETVKAINKKWFDKFPDRKRKSDANYYAKNREAILERDRKWRLVNAEQRRANTKRWRIENPEKAKVSDRNKKLMRRGAFGRHTVDDLSLIRNKQKGECAYCQTKLSQAGEHVDHITPLARGGSNWPDNLQLLCPPCNMRKHASDPIDFARREGRLL